MAETKNQDQTLIDRLPGLDCGICGFRTCAEFADLVAKTPEEIKRCTNLENTTRKAPMRWTRGEYRASPPAPSVEGDPQERSGDAPSLLTPSTSGACAAGGAAGSGKPCSACDLAEMVDKTNWKDSLGRDFDFVLDTFPNEPGPRETMLPHNPQLTKELNIARGDIMIGRPLGMSCGCPITHCGVVMDVEPRTGVIVWCVTGPLGPRSQPHKDIGFYSAEAYEGLVRDTRSELKIGMRYWFMPRRCMLQWRHSGLINFMNKTKNGTQVRIEGLFIG